MIAQYDEHYKGAREQPHLMLLCHIPPACLILLVPPMLSHAQLRCRASCSQHFTV